VTGIQTGARFTVHTDSGTDYHADGVVLATDVSGLQQIVDKSPALGTARWRQRIARLHTAAPFVVQRLWLDRRVNSDRPAFLGTGGRSPLDNVSVLDRYEAEAATWSSRTGGSVIELHSYAIPPRTERLSSRCEPVCTSSIRRLLP
jgi:isorenieratene synthase